jgi:hypothetical protein
VANKVCLAYVRGTDVSDSWHSSWFDQINFLQQVDGILDGGFIRMRYGTGGIVEARNKAVDAFMQTDADWLWWVDTDMGFAPDTVVRLLEVADPVERPIVGALCFAMKETGPDGFGGYVTAPRPTIFDWRENAQGQTGFMGRVDYMANSVVRCAATGSACVLIHRSVFEKLGPNPYNQLFNESTQTMQGEDMSFCARAQQAGFPVYVHTGVRTTHHKEVWLSESDYLAWFQPPPATEGVTVIVPVLNRPGNVQPLMESLQASTGLAQLLFVVEEDDKAERDALFQAGAEYLLTKRRTFAEKVNDAWGQAQGAPWIMLAGDDVRFRPGWLNHAMHVARVSGADVVGTNDLGNPAVIAGRHATHMLLRNDYVREVGGSWDGPGIVCHEGYRHNFVDNEIVEAARQRGVWAPSLGAIVEHLHPAWNKNTPDDVYALGNESYESDRELFVSRLEAQRVAV